MANPQASLRPGWAFCPNNRQPAAGGCAHEANLPCRSCLIDGSRAVDRSLDRCRIPRRRSALCGPLYINCTVLAAIAACRVGRTSVERRFPVAGEEPARPSARPAPCYTMVIQRREVAFVTDSGRGFCRCDGFSAFTIAQMPPPFDAGACAEGPRSHLETAALWFSARPFVHFVTIPPDETDPPLLH